MQTWKERHWRDIKKIAENSESSPYVASAIVQYLKEKGGPYFHGFDVDKELRRPSLQVLIVNRNYPTEFTMSLHLPYFRKPEVLTTYFYSIAQEVRCNTLVFFQILALTASNL